MKLEQFICSFIAGGYRQGGHKLPLNWYGTYNAITLYIDHPFYSPFMDLPRFDDGRPMLTHADRERNIHKLINRGIPDIPNEA